MEVVLLPQFWQMFLSTAAIAVALSADCFAAGFSYGASGIKIPLSSGNMISVVCSGILVFSLLLGGLAGQFLSHEQSKIICAVLLFALGIAKLLDGSLKAFIRRLKKSERIVFSAMNLNFMLTVYADPDTADADLSKCLSLREAAVLASALSLDGLGVGFGAAIGGLSIPLAIILSYIGSLAAIFSGAALGGKMTLKEDTAAYLSGTLLIFLAFTRL